MSFWSVNLMEKKYIYQETITCIYNIYTKATKHTWIIHLDLPSAIFYFLFFLFFLLLLF